MNAVEQAKSLEFASKIAAVVNLFQAEFPDARVDLKPWSNDPDTRQFIDPDSIDLGFHFPGWSRKLQSRSILVQIRLHCDGMETAQRIIGVEAEGFDHRGQAWRLSTIGNWQFVGEAEPAAEVCDKLKHFCREVHGSFLRSFASMPDSMAPLFSDQLTEPTSMALLAQIQWQPILTTLSTAAPPITIATTYVHTLANPHHPPLLLLHGFDSSVLEFRRLFPLLACEQETWALDLLGFGFTERPPSLSFNPEAIKAHLYGFWQALIQRPMTLVGASMGGAAAIDFALSYPQAVAKLVLIDSAGFTPGPVLGKFLVPPLGYLATEFLRHPRVRQGISASAYHDPSLASQDAQHCSALHLGQPGWRQALISFTQSGGYPSLQPRLPQLQTPTLILWGQSDRILGTAVAQSFQGAIAGSQLVWIPDCGHLPHLEKPQFTAEQILAFGR
ncbi:alpha/beta hydrolase [Neosynechococcus sphagnicola]